MKKNVVWIFSGLTVLYVILSLIYAINCYPLFFQDGLCFLPTSYFINHQHQLINPLYDAGIDPISHRFLFYPPLFPYIVAVICKLLPDTYNQFNISLSIIDISSVIILLRSAYIYIRNYNINYNIYFYLFLTIWTIALFSFHGTVDGRPEILSDFFIACFLLNNLSSKSKYILNIINGILIGLNAINSPISTFYLIIITAGILFYNNNFKVKPILQTVLGFSVVFACFASLYPYHLIDLFHGLIKHSGNVVVKRANDGSDRLEWLSKIYFFTPFHPFAAISFLISIFYTLYFLIKRKKVLSVACFVLLFMAIYYFAFKNVLMSYNMFVLSSLYVFALLMLMIDILNRKLFVNFLNASFLILFTILIVNSLGLFRTALLYFSTQDKVVTIDKVEREINFLSKKLKKDKKILLTFSLWQPALNQVNSVTSYTSTENPIIQYVIYQQSNSGLSTPPNLPGFKLIKNGFIPNHPMFWKIKIGNTYPYYQIAIYEKE